MSNHDNGRNPAHAFAEMASTTQRLFQQSWQALGGEGLASALGAAVADGGGWESLLRTLQTQVDALFEQLHQQTKAIELPLEQMLGFCGQLNRMQDIASRAAGELPFPWSPEVLALINPKLGLFQQRQQRLDEIAAAVAELRAAHQHYNTLLRRIADQALTTFRQEIEQRPQRTAALREIYDLWLNSSEAAYERMLYSDEYASAFGRLVNSAAALTAQFQQEMDGALKQLNLPSRQEMNSTQRRLYELRRSHHAESARDELDALRSEMAELRAELQQLKSQAKPKPRAGTRTAARENNGD